MVIGLVLLLEPKLLIDQIHLGTSRRPGPVHLRHLHRHGRLHRHRDDLQHGRGGGEPRTATCRGPSTSCSSPSSSSTSACRWSALSAMPVKYNVLPVDSATGMTSPCRSQVRAGRARRARTCSSQRPPAERVYVPVEQLGDGTLTSSRRRSRPGEVYTQDGQRVTKLYGTQLGSDYMEDPVQGIVQLPARRASAGCEAILAPWVGILAATILVIATNAGIIGVVAPRLLAGPAPPAAADPRPRAPQAAHAVRGDHPLRRRRLRC